MAHVVDYNYSTLPLQKELATGNMETNGCNGVPFLKKNFFYWNIITLQYWEFLMHDEVNQLCES